MMNYYIAGMRHSLPNARIMIHQPSGGAQGQATDIQIQAEEIVKLKRQLINIYVKHTGKSFDFIQDNMERDKFMNPVEAKEFGLIDVILEHPPKIGEDVEVAEAANEEGEEGEKKEKEEEPDTTTEEGGESAKKDN